MTTTTINIPIDQETKAAAQKIFAALGLDMTTAINLFLRQTVHENDIPFTLVNAEKGSQDAIIEPKKLVAVRPPFPFGIAKGKVWMADDFNEPLEDFEEYM